MAQSTKNFLKIAFHNYYLLKDEPHLDNRHLQIPRLRNREYIFFHQNFSTEESGRKTARRGKGKEGTLTSILWDVKRSQSRSTLNARTNDDCDANWLDKEEKSHWSLGIRDDKRLYSKRNQSVL